MKPAQLWLADSLTVGQAIFWVDGFAATGAGQDGAVSLTSAHIGGGQR